ESWRTQYFRDSWDCILHCRHGRRALYERSPGGICSARLNPLCGSAKTTRNAGFHLESGFAYLAVVCIMGAFVSEYIGGYFHHFAGRADGPGDYRRERRNRSRNGGDHLDCKRGWPLSVGLVL